MTLVKLRIEIGDGSGLPRVYERESKADAPSTPDGERYLVDYLELELNKELTWGEHHGRLPQVEDIGRSSNRSFTSRDIGEYFNRVNSGWVWFEIRKTFLEIQSLLSHSKSYKELEPSHSDDLKRNNLLYKIHFIKMEKFNLAVFLLRKIEDLFLRLVFENLGPSLCPTVDITKEGWERNITWKSIRGGMREGRPNPALSSLTDEEFAELVKIMDEFGSPQYSQNFVEYRNRLTHGLMPSVDYTELYTSLEDRVGQPIVDATGKETGRTWDIGAIPTKAEYVFLDLYDWAVKTFEHSVAILRRLQVLPRFTR